MTIGTFTILILGLAYLVWSYYSIKDYFRNKSQFGIIGIKEHTKGWVAVSFIIFMWVICIVVLPYLMANCDKPLW